ncbi:MAG: response regulator transcription factor [Ignavibacteriaceae bacterium]|nr:response regulator transcription factor [Ignavibacteriaceae bacterium]
MRILICDDHALIRSGIINHFLNEPDYYIVGEAENGHDLIQKYELLKPDLIITDISMPVLDGTAAVKQLKAKYPGIKVLFISVLQGDIYIYLAIKVGGLGLIEKNISKGELLFAIREVYYGRYYFGPRYNEIDINRIIKKYTHEPIGTNINPDIKLTAIEEKILEHINDGLSTSEIAKKLDVGTRTIDTHRSGIMHKFDLKDTFALIRFAVIYAEFKKKQY